METTRDLGWAECFIPLQNIQPLNLKLDEPKKQTSLSAHTADRPIAHLSYQTPNFKMPTLSLLTPFLKVYTWDSSTGRLELEVEHNSMCQQKFLSLDETLLDLLAAHPSWLKANKSSKEELKHTFQRILKDNIFTIYLHGQNQDTKPAGRVWIQKDGVWSKGAIPSSFKRGQQLRVAVRLQGVCFLQYPGQPTRLRIQHQTVAVLHKTVVPQGQ